ncbi:putative addiction module antidote protein [Moraxella nasibovis]|uniref:addiction module antidote protein n=1 Tax=Moraxella nasibovis TaxID=2904120 RepID=UPI00240F928C|nr:addiction module antidote protein [Moraxella nasibovis]WFF39262.1 putative addiction module antidote protein [Moraxella nasibovis]
MKQLTKFDVIDYLQDEQAIADYLAVVLEENDMNAFLEALGTVAKARSMTQVAQQTGLNRESLYKALNTDGSPKFDTIAKVVQALGLRLTVQPA